MSRTSKGVIEKRVKSDPAIAPFSTGIEITQEQADAILGQSKLTNIRRGVKWPVIKSFQKAPSKAKRNRAALLARAKRAADAITDEEDAAITAAALTDPDALPNRTLRRVGRPASTDPKLPVNLRLDREVVEYFKAEGDGWQTRLNAALRKAAGLD